MVVSTCSKYQLLLRVKQEEHLSMRLSRVTQQGPISNNKQNRIKSPILTLDASFLNVFIST
jgi:hypothetical protein